MSHGSILASNRWFNLNIDEATLQLQRNFLDGLLVLHGGDTSFLHEVSFCDVTVLLIEVDVQLTTIEFLSQFHVFDGFSDDGFLFFLSIQSFLVFQCLLFVLSYELLSWVEEQADLFDVWLKWILRHWFFSRWNNARLRHIWMQEWYKKHGR